MIPDNYFLYALFDKDNRSYYVDSNGGVSLSAAFIPLKHKPIGWQEMSNEFSTYDKYFTLQRSSTTPLEYVYDGAEIIRYELYKGKGFEAEIYIIILKYNPARGIHELEYRGRIEMATVVDDPNIGIKVNGKQDGMTEVVLANDSVTYELPLNETNPDAIKVLFDGVELFDKLNFKTYPVEMNPVPTGGGYTPLPMFFSNNEGDSIGVVRGDQSYEPTPNFNPYTSTSGNYAFSSVKPITVEIGRNADGTDQETRFTWRSDNGASGTIIFFWYTSKSTGGITTPQKFFQQSALSGSSFTVNWRKTINLAADEKLFIMMGILAPGANNVTVTPLESTISLSFTTKNDPSYAWCLRPEHILKQLAGKMSDGKYTAASNWFAVHNNIVMASGMSFRNLPKAVLKITFEDFFHNYNTQYCMCLNINNDVLYMEGRPQFYDGNGPVYDAGSISGLKIAVADENIVNTVKYGWPDQKYDERNGRYEYNSTAEAKLPVTIKKATLDLVSKARGDSYGMEFIRGKLNNKDTTDDKGDNESFMVNVEEFAQSFTDDFIFSSFPFLQIPAFNNSLYQVFGTIVISGSALNNGTYTVISTADTGAFGIQIFVKEPLQAHIGIATITFYQYKLKRETYDIDPPVNLRTNTVFNIEEMTPMRRLMNWEPWLHGILYQLPGEKVSVQSGLKNMDLVTVLNGVTIAEKQDLLVGTMAAPFFLNYNGQFTVETKQTFNKTFSNLQASTLVKVNYNGFDIYFIPKGKMSSKSVTNEAQEWELLLSAKNNLDTIHKLSREGALYLLAGMDNKLYSSVYNPVHWVKYGYQTPAGIKYKGMFDDWLHHRNDQFAVQPAYFQKWEKTDPISNQFLTHGINQLELYIYDADAILLPGYPVQAAIIPNPTVQAPYTLQQFDLDISAFATGNFLFVIKQAGSTIPLCISEWQTIDDVHPGTYRYNYSHSYNHLDAFFNNTTGTGFVPVIRVESMWGKPESKFSGTDYTDEPNNLKLLHSSAYEVRPLHLGRAQGYRWGIPDWLQVKLNRILSLDQLYIENEHIVRPDGSVLEENKRNGFPMSSFVVELQAASGNAGLTVLDDGTVPIAPSAIYTIDAELYGQSGKVIQAEIKP